MRVVRTPSGVLAIDETGRLAGRGAYLCRSAECWRLGVERGGLRRALAVDLGDEIRAALLAGPDSSTGAGGPEQAPTAAGPIAQDRPEAAAPDGTLRTGGAPGAA